MTPESFAQAYIKGFRLTVGFLRSKGASLDVAEELAQTAWARGWEALSTLRAANRIVPWVNSIAFHRFCNDQRRAAHQRELIEMADKRRVNPSVGLDTAIVMRHCSASERELLTMRYLDGMETRQIAEAQGVTEVAIRVRLHRCQASLRRQLGVKSVKAAAGPKRCQYLKKGNATESTHLLLERQAA